LLRNISITVSEEVARWVRKKAAEQHTSVSRLVSRMLENQMRGDAYWRAYRRWKRIGTIKGIDAAGRMARAQAQERP
jgi:hypothetical protein